MATHQVNLFNSSILPLNSFCFFAPYAAENSGTTQDPDVLHMITSVVSVVKGLIRIPDIYVGTPVTEIVWTSETTANTVDYKFRHRTMTSAELLDTSTSPTELEDTIVNNGGPAAASGLVIDTISLTTTDISANKYMYFELERDGVTDDKADTVTVWFANFLFDDA